MKNKTKGKQKASIDLKANEKEIAREINQTSYKIKTTAGVVAKNINELINWKFIQSKLNNKVNKMFNIGSFKFLKITINDKALQDHNLTENGLIKAKINYTYGSMKRQKTNLEIDLTVSDQQIVDAIKKVTYEIATISYSSEENINDKITGNFIKEELPTDFKNAFDLKSFNFNQVLINNQPLRYNDLIQNGTITTKINYDYGQMKNQETHLTINLAVSDQQIVEEIKEKNYKLSAPVDTQVKNINPLIKGNFIAKQLSNDVAKAFKTKSFIFQKIVFNGKDLQDNDLIKDGILNVKINFNYGTIKNQSTNLTMTLTGVGKQQVIDAINKANYQIESEIKTKVNNINSEINAKFIKKQLSGDIARAFNLKSFKFKKITINKNNLKDNDLLLTKTIDTKINYDYDALINQEANLKIKLTVSKEQIVNEIKNLNYEIKSTINTKNTTLGELITSDFIAEKLTGEIAKSYDAKLFKFSMITVSGHNLTNSDLKTARTINAKINYRYGALTGQETNLKIELTVSQQQIVDAIKVANYQITTKVDAEAKTISDLINPDFIKKQLSGEFAKFFDMKSFTFQKITINDKDLQNRDLMNPEIVNTEINYNYGAIKNQKTNLTIKLTGISKKQVSEFINKINYRITTTINTKASSFASLINGEFIHESLTGDIAKVFNPKFYKFNKITVSGDNLADSDLVTAGIINTTINYNYDTVVDKETNLTIKVVVSDKQIVDAINSPTDELRLSSTVDNKVEKINDIITDQFIVNKLMGEIAKAFNPKEFKFKKITVAGHTLKESDLATAKPIAAKINYDYGSLLNQAASLKIELNVGEEQIATAIKKIDYQLITKVDSTTKNINALITGNFIKSNLTGEIAKAFNISSFAFHKITIDENDLQDHDLTTPKTITGIINYDYAKIKNQKANLTIKLTGVSQKQTVAAINDTRYEIITPVDSHAKNISALITGNFIKNELSHDIAKPFDMSAFTFHKIINNGTDLKDSDLINPGTVRAKISYDYARIKNQETNLAIKLTGVSQKETVEAISKIKYQITITINSKISNIMELVTNEFILEKFPSEIKKAFDIKLFKFNKITVNEVDLTNNDLATARTVAAKINYNYGAIKNQTMNLIIDVVASDQQIVDAIKLTKYELKTTINHSAKSINELINGAFISNNLTGEIARNFNLRSFKFKRITVAGHNLKDSDLLTVKTLNAKINYNYGSISNQETILTIDLSVSDEQMITQINKIIYEKSLPINSSIQDLNNLMTGDFIKKQLTGEFAKHFKNKSFKFVKIVDCTNHDWKINQFEIADSYQAKINYDYDSMPNQKTKLTIKVTATSQQIVEAINNTIYKITTKVNSEAKSITVLTTGEFIKTNLNGNAYRYALDSKLYKFNKVTIKGIELQDTDLIKRGEVNAKINYNYDLIANQETTLKIELTGISHKEIADAINAATYSIANQTGSTTNSIKPLITEQFIKEKLSGETKDSFNISLFKVISIAVGNDLSYHFDKTGTFDAKIYYDYGLIKSQKADLTIKTTPNLVDEKITGAINSANYTIANQVGSTTNDLKPLINEEFIKEKLPVDLKETFNINLFKLNTITANGNFSKPGTYTGKINYDYAAMLNQTINLTITTSINEEQVANKINETSYQIETRVPSKISDLKPLITGDFIQAQLPEEFKKVFKANFFSLMSITINDFTEKIFNEVETTNAKINYNYEKYKNQTTNLAIKVLPNIEDEKITNAINSKTYQISVKVGATTDNIKPWISPQFIREALSDSIKDMFSVDLFELISITVNGEWKKFDKVAVVQAKITYNYDTMKKQTTNLKIKVTA